MADENNIRKQLEHVLADTDLSGLGEKYEGKVRDCYAQGNERVLITSDRISCFDRVITTIPFKGQVLNQMAIQWFKLTEKIAANHLIDVPDPNAMRVRNCDIFPIEIIVRGYLTGSAWRDYQAGKAISGIELPTGMKMSEKFSEPLITPSTKAPKGEHDMPISEKEILEQKIVDPELWKEARRISLELFDLGTKEVAKRGLILVDTKYEFGVSDGELLLADEVHTLDSSRFWLANTYQEKYAKGEQPDMLDKEVVRQWLIGKGYMGEGEIPEITDDYRVEVAKHYIDSYEKITGMQFEPECGNVGDRIKQNLSA